VSKKSLEKAILDLHGYKAIWIKSIPVKEVFKGDTVWEEIVQVFGIDHPKSKLCYAWSYAMDNSKKRKFLAVLHQGKIDSPQKAVKAAIIANYGNKKEST
jgi:hypothetical protein